VLDRLDIDSIIPQSSRHCGKTDDAEAQAPTTTIRANPTARTSSRILKAGFHLPSPGEFGVRQRMDEREARLI
jgi:hypothetical protein